MFNWKRKPKQNRDLIKFYMRNSVQLRTWQVGESIGGEYKVIGMFSGGFGVVYLATNKTLSETNPAMAKFFALKTFRPEIFRGPTTVDDFEREAYVWLKLGKHDNIVHAFFLERYEGVPFVVCEGIVNDRLPNTLRGWISAQKMLDGPSPPSWLPAIGFGIQLCIGMEFANLMGVECHCDLKPENVFLTDDSTIKIGDWGLSMLTSAALVNSINSSLGHRFPFSPDKLSYQKIAGTIPYMAPEVLRGQSPNMASDIYAFGSIMYEMLTFQLPYQAATENEWFLAHCSTLPIPLERWRDDIPEDLGRLVLKCLAKVPAERPQSFASLKNDLNDCAQQLTGRGFSSAFLKAENPGRRESNVERMFRALALHQLGAEEEAQRLMELCIAPEETRKPHMIFWEDGKYPGFYAFRLGKWRVGMPPEMVADAEEKVRNCPDDADAWSSLGNTYHIAGRLNDARSSYHRAVQLAPDRKKEFENHISLLDKDEVQDCLDRGEWYEQRGDHTEALIAYQRGLDIDQDDAMLWYDLGTVRCRVNDWAGAAEALARATLLNPEFLTAWNSLGSAHLQLGDPESAIVCFDKAITLDPSFKKPWFNRSSALMMLGKRDEAIRSIKKALEIDPDYEMARDALKQYLNDK